MVFVWDEQGVNAIAITDIEAAMPERNQIP
jgi:hypothetical protein